MTDFVGRNNNSTETAGIFNDGNTVDLLQTLVDNTRSADICEASLRKKIWKSIRQEIFEIF